MIVTFEQTYLQELYVEGEASDKKHRFQPQVISKTVSSLWRVWKLANRLLRSVTSQNCRTITNRRN